MPRHCKNFIDEFTRLMAGSGSPDLYIKWSAIFTVGAAMERRCWLTNTKGILYPSQFLILVGPAGVGKSVCTNIVYDLLQSITKNGGVFHIAPSSVTKASLIDALNKAERSIIRPMEKPAIVSFNSLTVIPNEFGVFLPSWEGDFMSVLTDIWNCKHYSETRRTKDLNITIPHTQMNLLSATTPAYLLNLLPEGAWETGFMSRTLMVYSGQSITTDVFGGDGKAATHWDNLQKDVKEIYKMFGEFTVTDEVVEAVNAWNHAGRPPEPDHPKLIGYNARRLEHVLKLCMISSAATDDDRIISLENWVEALDWLVELEAYMPDIFKSLKVGGDGRAMEDCWYYAMQYFMKKSEPIPESLVHAFLNERIPAHSVDRVIGAMCNATVLKKVYGPSGGVCYEPKRKS